MPDEVQALWEYETEWWDRYTHGKGEFKVKDDIDIPDWFEEEDYE